MVKQEELKSWESINVYRSTERKREREKDYMNMLNSGRAVWQ